MIVRIYTGDGKFIALMPQWDFLNFVAQQGKRYKTFELRMNAEATDLVEQNGRIIGLRAKIPDGTLTIRAALVVGYGGRHSTVPVSKATTTGRQWALRLRPNPRHFSANFSQVAAGVTRRRPEVTVEGPNPKGALPPRN
jgi:2-polyprenyl-6-methoxyphenol hydroxylase-like FAD-dependent oxidoreductase